MAHACNPSIWGQRQEDQEFKVILGHLAHVRPRLHKTLSQKKKKEESSSGCPIATSDQMDSWNKNRFCQTRAAHPPKASQEPWAGSRLVRIPTGHAAWAHVSSAWKTAMTGSSWVVTTSTLRNLSKSVSSWERRVFSLYMISSRW